MQSEKGSASSPPVPSKIGILDALRDEGALSSTEIENILGVSVIELSSGESARIANLYADEHVPLESRLKTAAGEMHSIFRMPVLVEGHTYRLDEGLTGVMSVAVGYADESGASVFQGDIPGEATQEVIEGDWTNLWVPRGYDRTLSELHALPHILDKREVQYLRLAEYLGLPGAADKYEAHVTVDCDSLEDWDRFAAACRTIGIKGIQIRLPEGEYPTHLITASWHRGHFEKVKAEVYEIGKKLEAYGFPPTRHKIEAMLGNEQVPRTDEDAKSRPKGQYFEFHVKVAHGDEPVDLLAEICDRHGAHLSRSASNRVGSEVQRFITVRYRTGLARANQLFDAMLEDLESSDYGMSNRLREYTVFDDGLEQDRGWADEVACAHCPVYDACAFRDDTAP